MDLSFVDRDPHPYPFTFLIFIFFCFGIFPHFPPSLFLIFFYISILKKCPCPLFFPISHQKFPSGKSGGGELGTLPPPPQHTRYATGCWCGLYLLPCFVAWCIYCKSRSVNADNIHVLGWLNHTANFSQKKIKQTNKQIQNCKTKQHWKQTK